MADITTRQQGEVDESGKVNWRGDQSVLPQGGQSVYKSSTVQLAQLGSRRVVGDRVFRYMKSNDAIKARQAVTIVGSASTGAGTMITVTGGTGAAGGKRITLDNNAAGTCAKNEFAEGYIAVDHGTAHTGGTNAGGYLYRIKSHPAMAASTTGEFILYDPLVAAVQSTDFAVLYQNLYYQVGVATATGQLPVAISPVNATKGDYFWGQTWGPAYVNVASAMAIGAAFSFVAGQATIILDTYRYAGVMLTTGSVASRGGIAFIALAP